MGSLVISNMPDYGLVDYSIMMAAPGRPPALASRIAVA
jgi:hypothetical protein